MFGKGVLDVLEDGELASNTTFPLRVHRVFSSEYYSKVF